MISASLLLQSWRILLGVCAGALLLSAGGCDNLHQDMGNQPKYKALAPSEFFGDGRSERPILENTVARGSLANDELSVAKESNAFPVPVDMKLLERGEERYKIFCTMRGMKHPPSYHDDTVRKQPNGYFYDVITNGFGSMLGYSAQIPPKDRWAIVAYVRALQLSRNARVSELPAELREKLESGGTAK
jgi:hypothetical protein